jgi:5-methylcytosine-specific restriction endonuclease McrA
MSRTFVPAHAPLSPAQMAYRRYLTGWRWWILRRLRLRIDGRRCRICNEGEPLQMHHRGYEHAGRSWWGELSDLTALCPACHDLYEKERMNHARYTN